MPDLEAGLNADALEVRASTVLPEALLWHELRKSPGGLRFRRRRSTGKYAHDFYCLDARLAIEIDGDADGSTVLPTIDNDRRDWLDRAGIATLHVPASRLMDHSRLAADEIIERARLRLSLHHPARADMFPELAA